VNCADCGKPVELRRGGRWGVEVGPNSYSFTCRTIIEGDRLIRADYHYVEGEEQRHYNPEIPPE
jgi:hypothetical protein